MLTIKNIDHIYPNGVQALKGVNIDIKKGMFGLLGPNGAGKSSLMRTIATLQQPTAGSIQFGGIDVIKNPEQLRRVLGYLPQEFGVYPRGSACELLDHIAVLKGIKNSKERKEMIERLLYITNLYDVRNRRLKTYSGGMLQRFGIAQVLLGKPQLIIVDEPTAGLDPEERNRFHNMLSEIGEDIVVILSTHIVEDVSVLCSSMAIMNGGEIVLQGAPEALIGKLNGYIWQKAIDKSELDHYRAYCLISHHQSDRKVFIRVFSQQKPGEGFESPAPNLEDVYFVAIKTQQFGNVVDLTLQPAITQVV